MKNKLHTLIILLALAIPAGAQVYEIEVGPSVIRSSNYDPPNGASGGGNTFPGVYYRAAVGLPKSFEAQVIVRASRTPQLQTQFTTDESTRQAAAELRVHPQLKYGFRRFYFAAGAEISKQFFPDDRPSVDYSQSYNLNPTATAGARLTNRQEASFTYLFKDQDTYLYGYRANYSYAYPITESVAIVIGAEANHYTFRETNRRGYYDPYYEHDGVFLFDVAFRFGSRKHRY